VEFEVDTVELDDQTWDPDWLNRTKLPLLESFSSEVEGFEIGFCRLATQTTSCVGMFLNQMPM